jgi:hypothetical protein
MVSMTIRKLFFSSLNQQAKKAFAIQSINRSSDSFLQINYHYEGSRFLIIDQRLWS